MSRQRNHPRLRVHGERDLVVRQQRPQRRVGRECSPSGAPPNDFRDSATSAYTPPARNHNHAYVSKFCGRFFRYPRKGVRPGAWLSANSVRVAGGFAQNADQRHQRQQHARASGSGSSASTSIFFRSNSSARPMPTYASVITTNVQYFASGPRKISGTLRRICTKNSTSRTSAAYT